MSAALHPPPQALSDAVREPRWVEYSLIAIALLFLTLFLFVPLVAVFAQALSKGWQVWLNALLDDDA